MENELGYELGSWVVSQIDTPDVQTSFTLHDMEWEILPEVWPPFHDPGTSLFTSWVPYEKADSFLDMGCGTGIGAVLAAQRGCTRVVATDINPAAAESTRRNAVRHGVSDRVTALSGDLFEAVDPDEKFDIVFWNTPFIEAPADRPYRKQIERAVFDPGYGLLRRFFQDVRPQLAEGGLVYLGTSEIMGNLRKTLSAAAEAGFESYRYRSETVEMPAADFGATPAVKANTNDHGMVDMDFTLYEFSRR
jgi:release factor glutamine methyltransferase